MNYIAEKLNNMKSFTLFILLTALTSSVFAQQTDDSFDSEEYEGEIFTVVESQAFFGECPTRPCNDDQLANFLYTQLGYPQPDRSQTGYSRAIVRFVVERDGYVSNIELMRDPGGSCSQMAVEAVEAMNADEPKWTPGKQRGMAVRTKKVIAVKCRS